LTIVNPPSYLTISIYNTGRSTRTFFPLGPKNSKVLHSSRECLPTVVFLAPIFPTCLSEDLLSRLRGSYVCLPKSSDPRDPISLVNVDFPRRVGTSRYRGSSTISLGSLVPRSEAPRSRLLVSSPFVSSLLARLTSDARQPPRPDVPRSLLTSTAMAHAMHVISTTSALAFSRLFRSTYPVRPRETPMCPISE
jgi:hypothetical protein